MAARVLLSLAAGVLALQAGTGHAAPPPAPASEAARMVRVGAGTYRPLYPPSPAEAAVPVKAFLLDRYPVEEGDFLAFVKAHPEWRRDRVAAVFADDGYLSHWASPVDLGAVDPRRPVVRVSWFAAKAYCGARGLRLPTEAEWELAAAASPTRPDARGDAAWTAQILAWYETPNPDPLPRVGARPPNYYGVYDLHGLVWEWVLDFSASMVAADPRRAGEADKLTFCGGGAITAQAKDDYAAFMRIAFRSSLRADYTTRNLGFRCAGDVKEVEDAGK